MSNDELLAAVGANGKALHEGFHDAGLAKLHPKVSLF